MVGKYRVVTLCGSTRFKDAFYEAQKKLTLEGNIVISVGLFGHSGDAEVRTEGTKEMLDDMHKRKIDMADEIFVIDQGGYIGSSTRSEIEYARAHGKKVRYLEPLPEENPSAGESTAAFREGSTPGPETGKAVSGPAAVKSSPERQADLPPSGNGNGAREPFSGRKVTEVVAALIRDGKRFMACQRPACKARGLLWEFVGGKVEPGETKEEALIRECREELDIGLSVGDVFMEVLHEYPDLTVHLTLFNAEISSGTPKKLEHNDIRWLRTEEIGEYEFCPADEEILEELRRRERSAE